MDQNTQNYWKNIYWESHLEKKKDEKLDFLEDLWLNKYKNIVDTIPKGKALDLGCGLGQYTQYLKDLGFDVLSCDISETALAKLKENIPDAQTQLLDMSKEFPLEDKSFNLVFANLSIHYFDTETTFKLLQEIKRVLKPDGYFIGSVNSFKTYQFIKENAIELEPNYYQEMDRTVRLWNKEQFDYFFKEFELAVLEEVTTSRWNRIKIMWEFIAKPKELTLERKK